MLDECARPTLVLQAREADLSNDRTKLAAGSGDTVTSGTITGGEDLSGNDKGSRIRSPVLEEIGQAIEGDERFLVVAIGSEFIICETHDNEDDRQYNETVKLKGLATPGVDEEKRDPVARNQAGHGEDQVSNANILQRIKSSKASLGLRATEANGLQDDTGVESEAVISNL
jgi:hypothetical protein